MSRGYVSTIPKSGNHHDRKTIDIKGGFYIRIGGSGNPVGGSFLPFFGHHLVFRRRLGGIRAAGRFPLRRRSRLAGLE
jgi:hypothetical protein